MERNAWTISSNLALAGILTLCFLAMALSSSRESSLDSIEEATNEQEKSDKPWRRESRMERSSLRKIT